MKNKNMIRILDTINVCLSFLLFPDFCRQLSLVIHRNAISLDAGNIMTFICLQINGLPANYGNLQQDDGWIACQGQSWRRLSLLSESRNDGSCRKTHPPCDDQDQDPCPLLSWYSHASLQVHTRGSIADIE